MPTVSWAPPRWARSSHASRASVGGAMARNTRAVLAPADRRGPVGGSRREPESTSSREWIQVGAYLERTAPEDASADELGRVEDAAAERIYQRSRRGALAGSSGGYAPGSRKRSMPLRRGV